MVETLEQFATRSRSEWRQPQPLLIGVGALQTLLMLFDPRRALTIGRKRLAWLTFARWLVLALEFELAADIIRTAISPTWDDIGQLAAIAVIRTFLNFFLERDMKDLSESGKLEAGSAQLERERDGVEQVVGGHLDPGRAGEAAERGADLTLLARAPRG